MARYQINQSSAKAETLDTAAKVRETLKDASGKRGEIVVVHNAKGVPAAVAAKLRDLDTNAMLWPPFGKALAVHSIVVRGKFELCRAFWTLPGELPVSLLVREIRKFLPEAQIFYGNVSNLKLNGNDGIGEAEGSGHTRRRSLGGGGIQRVQQARVQDDHHRPRGQEPEQLHPAGVPRRERHAEAGAGARKPHHPREQCLEFVVSDFTEKDFEEGARVRRSRWAGLSTSSRSATSSATRSPSCGAHPISTW